MSSDRPVRRREIEDATAARLAEILAAAEQAAKQVIDEAEEEAQARISDAHEEADRIVADRLAGLARLTEEIGAQAEGLRRQTVALQEAIATAKAELAGAESFGGSRPIGDLGADPGSGQDFQRGVGPSLTVVGAPRVEQPGPGREGAAWGPAETDGDAPGADAESQGVDAGSEGSGAEEARPSGSPAGARLLATQMAVSGSSRTEIEARLRDGFAISDPGAILDAILGPEN